MTNSVFFQKDSKVLPNSDRECASFSGPCDGSATGRQGRHECKELWQCAGIVGVANDIVFSLPADVQAEDDVSSTIVHPREVFKAAILANSAGIIVAHNHPSGDPTPSAEDVALTKRLLSAGDVLGIEVLDHMIVGANRYFSFLEGGQLR